MRRLHLAKLVIVLTVAGLAWAVQHDTFVRRWLVPTRPAAAATPLLDRVVPEVNFYHSTLDESVAHLAKVTGIQMPSPERQIILAFSPMVPQVYGIGWRPGCAPPGVLHGLTVRQLLRRLFDNADRVNQLHVTDQQDRLAISYANSPPIDVIRVYDIADLLHQPPHARSSQAKKNPAAARSDELMTNFHDGLGRHVYRFGTHVICAGDAEMQRNATDLLVEERAKPANALR